MNQKWVARTSPSYRVITVSIGGTCAVISAACVLITTLYRHPINDSRRRLFHLWRINWKPRTPNKPMFDRDLKLHIFVFFLRACLFIITGIVLHATMVAPGILDACPVLWESMTLILSLKCIRITLCRVTMHHFDIRTKSSDYCDMIVHLVYFCVECTITSCSLNSRHCVEFMSNPFGGHPIIAYVNGISCAWDGCLTLSMALYTSIDRSGRPR